jgi:ABC-2 type transport system ATP-binding protein
MTQTDPNRAWRPASPAVTASHLTKRFGKQLVVDGVSFVAEAGQVTALLGPNGSGKSTVFGLMTGLLRGSGRTDFFGIPYGGHSHPRQVVGLSMGSAPFHPGRTARAHLTMVARSQDIDASRVDTVLDEFDLVRAAERRTATFSLGMKQRLSLATAMLGDPKVLLLDEPTNALDPLAIRWFSGWVRARAAEGRCVVMSSHDLHVASAFVDSVVLLLRGKVKAAGTIPDLIDQLGATPHVRVVSPAADRLAEFVERAGGHILYQKGDNLRVSGSSGEEVGQIAATQQLVVEHLSVARPGLQELFDLACR